MQFRFVNLSQRSRRRRQKTLIDRLEALEVELMDVCSAILEVTEPGDAVSIEVRRLLEAFEE
jgi:hypothetical protein